jgi:hypothetical protein
MKKKKEIGIEVTKGIETTFFIDLYNKVVYLI